MITRDRSRGDGNRESRTSGCRHPTSALSAYRERNHTRNHRAAWSGEKHARRSTHPGSPRGEGQRVWHHRDRSDQSLYRRSVSRRSYPHASPSCRSRRLYRSMATRGQLGGLAAATSDLSLLLDAAGYDIILIETVGVGQDEVDVARFADVTAVVLVPGSAMMFRPLRPASWRSPTSTC